MNEEEQARLEQARRDLHRGEVDALADSLRDLAKVRGWNGEGQPKAELQFQPEGGHFSVRLVLHPADGGPDSFPITERWLEPGAMDFHLWAAAKQPPPGPPPAPAALGARLRDLREQHVPPLSPRALAKTTGIALRYIKALEAGTGLLPTPEVLSELAEALDTTAADLLRAAGYTDHSTSSAEL